MAGRATSRAWAKKGRWMVVEQVVEFGPGSLLVGRFIGQLGVVPCRRSSAGWGLWGRVMRRHVARLETAGRCERMATIRGDGSLVWMTASGLDGVELVDLPALRAPDPFSIQTLHTVRIAWRPRTSSERTIDGTRRASWPLHRIGGGAEVANERGGRSRRLPDLVSWPALSDTPVAVVVLCMDRRSRDASGRPWRVGRARLRPANMRRSATWPAPPPPAGSRASPPNSA